LDHGIRDVTPKNIYHIIIIIIYSFIEKLTYATHAQIHESLNNQIQNLFIYTSLKFVCEFVHFF